MSIERPQLSEEDLKYLFDHFNLAFYHALKKKGRGIAISRHEMLGMITEEYHEVITASHAGKYPNHFSDELLDLAIAALFSWISEERIRRGALSQ